MVSGSRDSPITMPAAAAGSESGPAGLGAGTLRGTLRATGIDGQQCQWQARDAAAAASQGTG